MEKLLQQDVSRWQDMPNSKIVRERLGDKWKPLSVIYFLRFHVCSTQ